MSETHTHYTQDETSVEDSASKVSSKVYTITIEDSSNQERIQSVYTDNNSSSSKLTDYGQQDYLSVLEEMNKDVAIKPLQVTLKGLSSLEIPLTILGSKTLFRENQRCPEDLLARYKTLFAKNRRLSEEKLLIIQVV